MKMESVNVNKTLLNLQLVLCLHVHHVNLVGFLLLVHQRVQSAQLDHQLVDHMASACLVFLVQHILSSLEVQHLVVFAPLKQFLYNSLLAILQNIMLRNAH